MISESFLVTNKHLQLQLVLIQFLSAALADDGSNVSVEMVENSTQTALRNQIAGKQRQPQPNLFCTIAPKLQAAM